MHKDCTPACHPDEWDILEWEWADEDDRARMRATHAYDYHAQRWTHADHLHCPLNERLGYDLVLFCGADLRTCDPDAAAALERLIDA